MQLVMFDIDGTLVDSAGFDGAIYAQAVRDVLGTEVDRTWRSYRHVTDSGVLEEILGRRATDGHANALRVAVQDRFVAATQAYLDRPDTVVREVAGAAALIERLLGERAVRVAVATGGWRETAVLKLRRIGLDVDRFALATASDAADRVTIMQLAAQRAGGGGAVHRVTYFGDGAWDQRASATLGYDFIAVGRAVEHPVRFDDLTDQAAIFDRLGL